MANATASAQIFARNSGDRFGAGASSMTFWCRRCTLQSRSNRWMTLPWLSARICTSMWRGLTTACSRNTVGSPNADSASRLAASIDSASAARSATRRMPRPPPPATALTNSGNSMSSAASRSSSTDADGAEDASTGRPAALAAAIARALLPVSSSTCGTGRRR